MKRKSKLLPIILLLSIILAACGGAAEPEVVEVEVTRVVTETEYIEAEPTDRTVVEFWSTDNEPDRLDVYEAIAESYMAEHPDVEIRIVPSMRPAFHNVSPRLKPPIGFQISSAWASNACRHLRPMGSWTKQRLDP